MAKEEGKKTYTVEHPKLYLMVAKFDAQGGQLDSKLEKVPEGTEIELSHKAAKGLLAKGKISEKGVAKKAQVAEETPVSEELKKK